ncbi:MAG TPA: response regulator [Trueperaceae bacterium]|nr:response regulator [Trueperaceae bacterium]
MSDRFDVLLVEPDELQRQLIDVLLSDARIHIAEVTTAREALEHLRGATPDLAIVAAELPDLDGFALATRIKRVARLSGMPMIVTADPDAGSGLSPRLRFRGEEAHVDLVLPRPLGDKNLKERAMRLMLTRGEPAPSVQDRALRSTVALDEAIENLGHHTLPRSTAADTIAEPASPARAHLQRAELKALERENLALRRENEELRATIAQLKRQLPGGRNTRS